ncbi:MAG: sugar phosphate isomerase/epimerase [Fuerstiella sp.]|nr:sugar phosphate isomerase/epimerase [Fuerstiella sp.]
MSSGIRYCFNTSTIRGQELSIEEQVDVVGKAGYDGIEPWMEDLVAYKQEGGRLTDLAKRISDHGLTVESAIGFAHWIVDDEDVRRKGLEDAKHDMDLLREIGGLRIAAPPVGAQDGPVLDLFDIIDRYKALLAVGDAADVIPQLEVWGFSTNLHRLGHSAAVCLESNHPKACLLPDVYHLYRGGSDFQGLELLSDEAIHVFHMNDYPDSPARGELDDSDRVYPGDGVAPLTSILRSIAEGGKNVALSLELFNHDYWKQDAQEVATTGLRKMQDAVDAAGLS